jgi:TRAP-type C4-dicarboxylate transport system substrate-binding protein
MFDRIRHSEIGIFHGSLWRSAFTATILFLGVSMIISIIFNNRRAEATEKVRLRIAYIQAVNSLDDHQIHIFADTLEKAAPGYFKIELFPGGQLGTGTEQLQALSIGTLEAAALGSEALSVDPKMGIFEIPWIIKDFEHYKRIINGPWFEEAAAIWNQKNMQLVAMFGWGFRNILTLEPVRTLDGFRGKRIRIGPSPARVKFFRLLGAVPVTMEWASTYLALQQRTVDGVEAYPTFMRSGKMYEHAKYLDLINYTSCPIFITFSKIFWKKLPEKIQIGILKAGRESMGPANDLVEDQEQEDIKFMVDRGVTVVKTDLSGFEKVQNELLKDYMSKFGNKWLSLWATK